MGMGPLGMLGVLLLMMLRLLLGGHTKGRGGPSCCSKHMIKKHASESQVLMPNQKNACTGLSCPIAAEWEVEIPTPKGGRWDCP